MPTKGLLGKQALSANTWTTIATLDATKVVNIRIINRDLVNGVTVKLAVCPNGYVDGAVPADADWLEPPGEPMGPGGVIGNIAEPCSQGEKIVAWASAATVTVRASGL